MLDVGTRVLVDGMHAGIITAIHNHGYTVALDYGETLAHWDGESYSSITGEPLLATAELV